MNTIEEFISNLEEKLPPICRTKDLIDSGLIKSRNTLEYFRKEQIGPPYIQIGKRIVYPKDGILQWIKNNSHHGYQTTKYHIKQNLEVFPEQGSVA